LIELPTNLIDRSTQIAQGCRPRNNESSRFVVTGRGGLPLSPDEALRDRAIVSPDWVGLDSEAGDPLTVAPQRPSEHPFERSLEQAGSSEARSSERMLVEANGFSRDANGKTILIAQSHPTEPIGAGASQTWCDRP
jgi:large exoprotein involved in heme utilization and adhesion